MDEASPFLRVSGSVFNESMQPLSGANVVIKKSGKGTITNVKGEFSLSNVPENSTILISFIGYAPVEQKATADMGRIYLKPASNDHG